MMGINGPEFLIIAVLVLLVVGPERLPEVAKQGATWLKKIVHYIRDAKDSLTSEFGDEIGELKDLDPRQYDPRRIVQEAMREPRPKPTPMPAPPRDPEAPPPFDSEAT
ncbi:MAG: twin-arginine translocase TatA/TatE family subunit [Ruaniaceae bacterium]|nr:twin-arginine translocase TatA/TatE family subunit [Ruaniaceae bacterium]